MKSISTLATLVCAALPTTVLVPTPPEGRMVKCGTSSHESVWLEASGTDVFLGGVGHLPSDLPETLGMELGELGYFCELCLGLGCDLNGAYSEEDVTYGPWVDGPGPGDSQRRYEFAGFVHPSCDPCS